MNPRVRGAVAVVVLLAYAAIAAAQGYGPGHPRSVTANVNPAGANAAFTGIAVDASGNEFVAGYFDGASMLLGARTLTKIGKQDAFAAKFDVNGNVVWARNFGGATAWAAGQAIAVDNSGNVYLSGSFNSANLTTPSLAIIGALDAFAIKLDGAGNTIWARNFGGNGTFTGSGSIAADNSGNVYLGGSFQNGNLTVPALGRLGISDVYLIKLDAATGMPTWARNYGGSGAIADGGSIAVDGSSTIYLAGVFSNANLTLPSLARRGVYDAFVIKLDPAGAIAWASNFGGSGAWTYGQAVAVDGASHAVYLGGYFSNADVSYPALARLGIQDAYLLRLDSTGTLEWARNFGGAGAKAWGIAVAAGSSGDATFGGFFYDAGLTVPPLPIIAGTDAFAMKLDATGSVAWAHNYGGGSAQGLAVADDAAGNARLAGSNYGADMVVPSLPLIGVTDAFTIALDAAGNVAGARNYGSLGPPVTPPPISPKVGLWWNPRESGTGYAIDLQHGVAAVTIYSYNSDGSPQWYLMSGTLTPNNTVSGPLAKFRGGQCISCAYKPPAANGDDGTMQITFTSATTAIVVVEGGRSFSIVTPSF